MGEGQGIRHLSAEREAAFPRLAPPKYEVTEPEKGPSLNSPSKTWLRPGFAGMPADQPIFRLPATRHELSTN